ncbi:PEP-CTERM sorting domain-containing protein [Tardiphaga robiniae]|uniref:PEP-CTERM sorting domain-containing protein n=1 Tax=Tardiphaga robiniae TaxID=943830 RepID=A0A7G6U8E7_9BRAD|nr:PEP-CTERM sorting domain-containing protein [Tardiphaga robiniae]
METFYGTHPAAPTEGWPTDIITPAVPEPSTWAMMILGFAAMGAMTYRRRKIAARTI